VWLLLLLLHGGIQFQYDWMVAHQHWYIVLFHTLSIEHKPGSLRRRCTVHCVHTAVSGRVLRVYCCVPILLATIVMRYLWHLLDTARARHPHWTCLPMSLIDHPEPTMSPIGHSEVTQAVWVVLNQRWHCSSCSVMHCLGASVACQLLGSIRPFSAAAYKACSPVIKTL
jgi:hypothetical protein